ncbi:MAG TPA: hypothetical protein DD473_05515 [Planctomycetaceae bacterium]|nr:hypothetical protein [Planctomycetaceae bacterium]
MFFIQQRCDALEATGFCKNYNRRLLLGQLVTFSSIMMSVDCGGRNSSCSQIGILRNSALFLCFVSLAEFLQLTNWLVSV